MRNSDRSVFANLFADPDQILIFEEHPSIHHYKGKSDPRDWMFPTVTGYTHLSSAVGRNVKKYWHQKKSKQKAI